MIMKKNLLLILCGVLFIFACKKEKKMEEHLGRVVDYSDGSPIPDTRIVFFNSILTDGDLSPSLVIEAETKSDENGYFNIDPNLNASSLCAGENRDYFDNCGEGMEINHGSNMTIKLYPKSLVRIGIKDEGIYANEVEFIEIMPGFTGDALNYPYVLYPDSYQIIEGILRGGLEQTIYYNIVFSNGEQTSKNYTMTPTNSENPISYIDF